MYVWKHLQTEVNYQHVDEMMWKCDGGVGRFATKCIARDFRNITKDNIAAPLPKAWSDASECVCVCACAGA